MALTAQLKADFSQFDAAAKQAEAELVRMKLAADMAAAGINDMTVSAAPSFARLGNAARGVKPELNTLHQSLTQFDGVLSSVGVNLSGPIRGIQEIGTASGKTASEVGILGTVGLATGAALGGWQFGRMIAGWLGTDEAIGNATARLLGWGTVADAAGGAKLDVLAKASANAKRNITDFTEAMAINEAELKRQKGIAVVANDMAAFAKTVNATRQEFFHLTAAQKAQIDTATALGQSNAEIAKGMNLLASTVDVYKDSLARAAANAKELAAAEADAAEKSAKAVEATAQMWADYNTLRVEHGGTANEVEIARIQQWAEQVKASAIAAGTYTDAFAAAFGATTKEALRGVGVDWDLINSKSQEALQQQAANARATYEEMTNGSHTFSREVLEEQRLKMLQLQDAAAGMGASMADAFDVAAAAADKLKAATTAAAAAAAKAAAEAEARRVAGGSQDINFGNYSTAVKGFGFNGGAGLDLAEEGYSFAEIIAILRGAPKGKPVGPRIPGFAGGVVDFEGGRAWVGERGPELVTLPRGSNVTPNGDTPGGGASRAVRFAPGSIVINYPVMNDPKALDQLGQLLGAALWRGLRGQGVAV